MHTCIYSRIEFWGDWSSGKYCPDSYPVVGFKIWYLQNQGSSWWGDDQSVTAMDMICVDETVRNAGVGFAGSRPSKTVQEEQQLQVFQHR